jgi:hypothetical protein
MPKGGVTGQIGRAGKGDRRPARYPAGGIKGRASKRRDSGANSGRKTGPDKRSWPIRRKVGVRLRRPPCTGPKRWGRSASLKAWPELNDGWKKSASWKSAHEPSKRSGSWCAIGLLLISTVMAASQEPRTTPEPYAFVHVHVISMDRERVLDDQTVVIKDGRITKVGPSRSPGSGKPVQ